MIRTLISAAMLFVLTTTANAAPVVWDYSPDTTGASVVNNWQNISNRQNFVERFELSADTVLSGMDIFSTTSSGNFGFIATIRVFSNNSGTPDTKLYEFTETDHVIDSVGTLSQPSLSRKHVDFTVPVSLAAGSYFIGMSGSGDIAQAGLLNIDDNGIWQLSGGTISRFSNGIGDMAFRLFGEVSSVPAPSAFVLVGLGLIGLGIRRQSA